MGQYINQISTGAGLPAMGKVEALIADGAQVIINPEFQENLVCVVNNGFFEAAGYIPTLSEYEHFKRPDGRPRTWLIYQHAKTLAR